MLRNIVREFGKWMIAILCALFVLNMVTFAFYHPVHQLERNGGSTHGLMVAGQWGLYGTEGWGIQTIDSRGYPNPELPLEEEYYCIIGSSQTEGFHSMKGERFCDILNKRMGYEDSLKYYNIAHSGYLFDDMAKHFKGITEEFPEMKGIIFEINQTGYSTDGLRSALDQVGYDEDKDSYSALISNMDKRERMLIAFKNYFPVFRLLSLQAKTYLGDEYQKVNGVSVSENKQEEVDYAVLLDQVMALMRSQFDGEIYIVYHPMTTLNDDGTLAVNYGETDEIFQKCCEKYSIEFINMGPDFEDAFYKDHHAAYGFWNTTLESGHMNKYGHELIADRLYQQLKNSGKESK